MNFSISELAVTPCSRQSILNRLQISSSMLMETFVLAMPVAYTYCGKLASIAILLYGGMAMSTATVLSPVSDDANRVIAMDEPYVATVEVVGTSPFLFHRWSVEGVEAKGKAAKGSKAKKEDDVESYVYRNDKKELCIPGEYFRMAIIGAAKFKQDPRSPRKSAMDLFKAGVVTLDELCSLGSKEWDYLDRRRVMIQRNGITRSRPAMQTGWKVRFAVQVLLPEYIGEALLNEAIQSAGKLIGVGDFRPTFGRYQVTRFKIS